VKWLFVSLVVVSALFVLQCNVTSVVILQAYHFETVGVNSKVDLVVDQRRQPIVIYSPQPQI